MDMHACTNHPTDLTLKNKKEQLKLQVTQEFCPSMLLKEKALEEKGKCAACWVKVAQPQAQLAGAVSGLPGIPIKQIVIPKFKEKHKPFKSEQHSSILNCARFCSSHHYTAKASPQSQHRVLSILPLSSPTKAPVMPTCTILLVCRCLLPCRLLLFHIFS